MGNMRATLSGREFLSIVILFKKLLYIKEYEKKTTISICFSGNIQFQLYRSATIPIKNVPSPEIAGWENMEKFQLVYIREFRIYPCLFMN